MKRALTIFGLLWSLGAGAAEVIPPPPARYFNDYANVVSSSTAAQLNRTLEDFEKSSSSQVLVVVFPKMQSDSSIDDYTVRVAQSWRAGQKGKDNGAVLFVFVQDRKVYLQVGYGLEGALPDAMAKRIIDEQITPRFRSGDFNGGLTAGVQSIIAATRGEYKGTGSTVASRRGRRGPSGGGSMLILLIFMIILFTIFRRAIRGMTGGTVYRRRGYSSWGAFGAGFGSGWISGGGGGGGGGGYSGGGGGFSGGGGSFGGGGAGGSW